jgi:hypothetical protein
MSCERVRRISGGLARHMRLFACGVTRAIRQLDPIVMHPYADDFHRMFNLFLESAHSLR